MWNSLPEDVKIDCIARVSRCYYPTLSRVSKYFKSFISSPELYARRSILGSTEYCFYLGLSNRTSYIKWYIIRRKTIEDKYEIGKSDNWVVRIPPLPSVPFYARCLAVGSKIFMIGGTYKSKKISNVSVINCISHLVQYLPRFRNKVANLAVGSFNGKIYVIDRYNEPRIMEFDMESNKWKLGTGEVVEDSVAMSGKIYIKTDKNGYICDTEKSKWEREEIINFEKWEDVCIIDDIVYSYDEFNNILSAYDIKLRSWTHIKDLKGLPKYCLNSLITCCDGKLVVFLQSVYRFGKTQIWCAEIVVGKHKGGEILGNVECCDIVFEHSFELMNCLAVKI